ncbi:EAL domain-containing protein [uncultured Thiocystis sp.]|uniref:EAL domain-containing response regulator n=1 Tax=uncultured Thiocystis sp. TaxID=1202134 RepID=UPI0025EF4DE8|nr:EAL domain-containing protein [uncultured Thiocystis sp.]
MTPLNLAGTGRRVDYLGADQRLLTDLAPLLEPRGLHLTAFASLADLSQSFGRAPPAALLLDMTHIAGASGLERFLDGLSLSVRQRPGVICLASRKTDDETLEHRLAAMRAGANSYVLAPVPPRRLASRIIRMCGAVETSRYRILVVEDDPAQAKYIAVLLANAGMETLVVEDPMKLLGRMQAFRPNLILMDLYMPGATGAEMAAVIRDHDDLFGIPILFLSAETDLDKQLEALKAGGDGFIAKPIRRKQLIGAVEHRIRMSRWLMDRYTLDNRRESANGFLPRDVFMRHLDRIARSGAIESDGCGLLVIDIDDYPHILAALGLGGVEKLLRQMEIQISHHLTTRESATRLDDCRYGLIAQRETRVQLQDLARKLCALLAQIQPEKPARDVGITASLGIGLFLPSAGDAMTMISRGEKAAVSARRAGGNQFRVWTPVVARDGAPESDAMIQRLIVTALAQNGLTLLFQPILPFIPSDGEIYEAQIRLRTLDGEEIPPADFLSVATRGKLMPRVDRWVLERALEAMDRQRQTQTPLFDGAQGKPRLRLLVHQTIGTLAEPEWIPWFRDQVVQRNLIQLSPLFEFQMSDLHRNILAAIPVLERLRTYGIQVCVANVSGTPEEVALLGRLGARFAKLSFQTIHNTEQGQLIDLIERLREQGIAVIAAGIEDQDTIARVWNCHPDYLQGNYLQIPSPELNFDFQYPPDDH